MVNSFFPPLTPSYQIEVNGEIVEGGPWCWGRQRFAAGYLTADRDAVRDLLPSQELHPVAVRKSRALVMAYAFDCPASWGTWCPPFRYGEVGVLAFVTRGPHPAPPGVAAVLPMVSQRMADRWGFGMYCLQLAVSNRFARDLGNVFLGTNKFLTDVRNEQRRTTDRFAAEEGGALVFDVTVRSDGRPRRVDQRMPLYADVDDVLWAATNHAHGLVRTRMGNSAATVRLGEHPATEHLRSLDMSTEGSVSLFSTDYNTYMDNMYPIGPARRRIPDYAGSAAVQAALVVSPAPGVQYEAVQFPHELPFGQAPGLRSGPDVRARADAARGVARSPRADAVSATRATRPT